MVADLSAREPATVTAEQVQAVYAELLERPAAAFEMDIHRSATLEELRETVLASAEYRSRASGEPAGRISVREPPLVSIVTPSLNQGRFIAKTLASVAAQDYPAIEHIVVDGLSSDDTAEVVATFGDGVRFISERDDSQAQAINKGIALSRGAIVTWLNADDYLLDGAVSRAVATLEAHPDAGFVHGGVCMADADGRVRATWTPPPLLDRDMLRIEDYVAQPAAFYTRARWDEVGGVREDLHWTLDWDLFLKLAGLGPIVRVDGGPLATACLHPDSKTVTGGLRRYGEILRMLRMHGLSGRAAVSYGVELLERWLVRGGQAIGRPGTNIDILLGQGPLSGLRGGLARRFWPLAVSGDGWVGERFAMRVAPGRGDVIVEGVVPDWCPLDGQELTVVIDGSEVVRAETPAGGFALRAPAAGTGPVEISIRASRSFVPAESAGVPADHRRLAWIYRAVRRESGV